MTAVYDGDTIKIRFDTGREDVVRLIGVSCPELEDTREEIRFLAFMAKRFTYYHLYNKRVTLVYDWEHRDKYDRLLAYVFIGKRLFNEFLLAEGFAWIYLKYPFREDFRQRFIQASREARSSERGLWKAKPYPVLSIKELMTHIGQMVRVEFACVSCRERGNFIYLHSQGRRFSALIPRDKQLLFPHVKAMEGQRVIVTGFLEKYKGQPQILLFLPWQLSGQPE